MKKTILTIFALCSLAVMQAQVNPQPDTTNQRIRKPNHGTDSVISDHKIYNGTKGGERKAPNDTTTRRKNQPHNNQGMHQEHDKPKAAPTRTAGSPKYPH